MSKMQITLLLAVAAVTVVGAYTQGKLTDRWGNEVSERLATFSSRLDGVPTQIGEWTSYEVPVDEAQFKASNCHGVVSRAYKRGDDEVTVFLVSGKGYHVTIHTPDWCYVAAGYEMQKQPSNYSFEVPGISTKPEFLYANFTRVTATETTRLRILWSYSEEGKWTAPKLAKYSFAGKPALYKVYFIRKVSSEPPDLGEDPIIDFAKEFLPAISPSLFPGGEASPAKEPGLVAQR